MTRGSRSYRALWVATTNANTTYRPTPLGAPLPRSCAPARSAGAAGQ